MITVPPPNSARSRRAQLAERLRRAAADGVASPLSWAQERLWFLEQFHPGSALYNVPLAARLSGTLDVTALEEALRTVITRHEALRAHILPGDESPVQTTLPASAFHFRHVDLSSHAIEERQKKAAELVHAEAARPFDLAGAELLVRATLIRLRADEHRLVLIMHHIVSDEWSLKILFRELAAAYSARVTGVAPSLTELPIQYADYAVWQRKWLKGDVLERQLEYWKNVLQGCPPITELPVDRPRPAVSDFRGGMQGRALAPDLADALKDLAARKGVTLFILLLAAFKALIHRYTGREDVIVGTPFAGRNRLETEGLIGFFVNTLPLRCSLAGNPTFEELLDRVRVAALGAVTHQDLPLDRLVRELRPDRSSGDLPFTRLVFSLQTDVPETLRLPGLQVDFFDVDSGTAKFDLTLAVRGTAEGLKVLAEYDSDLFEADSIARLLEHFEILLAGVAANSGLRLSELPLLSATERRQLLIEWNKTATEYPRDKCIHEIFETRAEAHPDRVAVVYGNQSLTYGELNSRATQLAAHLRTFKVGPDVPVAICVEPSLDLIVGILGILKAGGAYVPLDPGYPRERLAFMLADTRSPVLLTQKRLASHLPRRAGKICLDTDWAAICHAHATGAVPHQSPEQLACVMYTSGSTGHPKGVMVPHRAINRLVLNTNYVQLDGSDRLAQISNVSFDAATFEIWGALLSGGQLIGIRPEVVLSPRDFARELRERGITAMFLTAALFNHVAAEVPGAFESVRTVIAGGEALDPNWVRSVLSDRPPKRLVNGYGPTENTTFTCCGLVNDLEESAVNVPIGRPISNTRVYILDANRNPVPVGVPGELYAGGDGLARGYWNRPELTEEKFVADPFAPAGGKERLYRTGDLARYRPDGSIEFLGRLDQQIKIRGFRVELGEIETILGRHPGVNECVVTASGSGVAKKLVAYFQVNGGGRPSTQDLRNWLKQNLPDYMVPAAFVEVETWPLTPNGKVDRAALPAPDRPVPMAGRKCATPRDAVELELVRIWEEVLNVRPIGIEDKFFELGGHSLVASRVLARMEKSFGKKLRLATIFQAPTVEELAAIVRNEIKENSITNGTSLVELQSKGTRPPVFLVHGVGGGMFWGYMNLVRRLGTDHPVFGFRSRGMDGRPALATIEEMAAEYVADLRKVQSRGPYHLGGYCFGGTVAYEMARQIEAAGESVALLALFNCAPPNSGYGQMKWSITWVARFLKNLRYWAGYERSWTPSQRREFLRWKWRTIKSDVSRAIGVTSSQTFPTEVDNLVDLSSFSPEECALWQAHIGALKRYHPQAYGGRIHLFRSPGHPLWCSFAPDYGWGTYARGGVEISVVPGAHEKILEEPCVQAVADEFGKLLNSVSREAVPAAIGSSPPSVKNPAPRSLVQLFEDQAARTPAAEAIVCGSRRITYAELRQRARRVAEALMRLGIGKESLVGIFLDRSEEMVAAMLGTMMAGGAYVPLDPAYPKERIAFLLKDSEAGVVITRQALASTVPPSTAQLLCVEDISTSGAASVSVAAATNGSESRDLAYVIYTSGSTGQPKGVALEHRGAVALVCWARDTFTREELAGVLACTSICFDLSVFEIFVPLSCGGKVILAENALALPGLPAAREVTLINTVPSAIRELLRVKGVPASVQVVNLAGEPLVAELVDQIYGETTVRKVYDLYGPTETTTYSTCALRQPHQPATIGRPLPGEEAHVLDEQRRSVPAGEVGELYIGGIGIARGYLHRPELTAERFVPHPLKTGERLYKTGDMVRQREDGNLIYLGRADHQVKLRGFRVELGEIESTLQKQPGVREAVVVVQENHPGDKRLVAFLTANSNEPPAADKLRAILKSVLPEYMVPASFSFIDALPLTPNGKVDRKALRDRQVAERDGAAVIVAPRNDVEERLAAIWREILSQDAIGVNDNFFEIGGHSLLAVRVVSRLRETFKVEAPMMCLFEMPTIAELANALAEGKWNGETEAAAAAGATLQDGPPPASFVQERLWFLENLSPGSAAYHVPLAFRLEGPLDLIELRRALEGIVSRHEALRTTFALSDESLTQVISPNATIELPLTDLSNLSASDANGESGAGERRVQQWLKTEASRPFDLSAGPLFRAAILRVRQNHHVLLMVMHHTIADGWSLEILTRELAAGYRACIDSPNAPSQPSPAANYQDFARRQRRFMNGRTLEDQLRYWQETLAGAPAEIDMPADHNDAGPASSSLHRHTVELSKALCDELRNHRTGSTPFMTCMAALAVTLQQWTGQNDMVIGTVVAGRNRREFEDVIGCFMNFLPIRLRLSEGDDGTHALADAKSAILDAQRRQDCPFEKIVEAVNPRRQRAQNPLYNVALVWQRFSFSKFETASLVANSIPVPLDAALLDLRFEADETARGISLTCEGRAGMFDAETIQQLMASFVQAIETLVRTPQTPARQFTLTPALQSQAQESRQRADRQTIAVAATFTAEPLAEPLRYWADRLKMPAAIEFAPYNQVFQELLDPASLLSRNRRGLNVLLLRLEDWLKGAREPEQARNILERSARDLVAALTAAAARTTAPFLVCICPISRSIAPNARLAAALADASQNLGRDLEKIPNVHWLSTRDVLELYPVAEYDDPTSADLGHVPYTPMFFTALATAIARKHHALQRPACKVIVLDCDNTLWSGACGEDGPDGIQLDPPRKRLQEFMLARRDAGQLPCLCSKNNEDDVRAVFERRTDFPLRFEHIAASCVNWLPKSENLKSLARELNLGLDSFIFVDDNPVECAEVEANCPEVLALLLPEDPQRIPEFLDHCWAFDLPKATAEDRRRAEMYRENADRERFRASALSLADFLAGLELQVTIAPVSPADLARVSQLTLRTNQFNFTGRRRSEGELQQLAGCEMLAVSAADRFGDYGLSGVLVFGTNGDALDVDTFLLSCRVLGRGIEHAMLRKLGEIARERNLAWVDAHFTPSARNRPALDFLESVGAQFKQALNGGWLFRFPSAFAASVELHPTVAEPAVVPATGDERIARPSASGAARKFSECRAIALDGGDIAAIHKRIESRAVVRPGSDRERVAPRTARERQLCEIWKKLLRVDGIGIRDDFFEMGGHSLLAVRLFAEIEKVTGRKLPVVTVFEAPTIEQMAPRLAESESARLRSALVPIRPKGSRPPLFLIHGAGGDVLWGYANLAAHVHPEQPLYGVKSRGQRGLEEFSDLEDIAAEYVKEITDFQPEGPYLLGGYCFGGNVAFEMARQLEAAGRPVALLALLDSAPSNAGYEQFRWWHPRSAARFARNVGYWLQDFGNWNPEDRRRFFGRKLRSSGRKILRRLRRQGGRDDVDIESVIDPLYFPEAELKLWEIHLRALARHVPRPYGGRATLFRTRGQPVFCSFAEDFCWGQLALGGVSVTHLPGSHENIFLEPHVRSLAASLNTALDEAIGSTDTNPEAVQV